MYLRPFMCLHGLPLVNIPAWCPPLELRQRHVTPRPPVAVTPAAARPPRPPVAVTPAAASLLLAPGATHAGPPLHSAPGGPPERILSEAAQQSLTKRPMTPGTLVPGVGEWLHTGTIS